MPRRQSDSHHALKNDQIVCGAGGCFRSNMVSEVRLSSVWLCFLIVLRIRPGGRAAPCRAFCGASGLHTASFFCTRCSMKSMTEVVFVRLKSRAAIVVSDRVLLISIIKKEFLHRKRGRNRVSWLKCSTGYGFCSGCAIFHKRRILPRMRLSPMIVELCGVRPKSVRGLSVFPLVLLSIRCRARLGCQNSLNVHVYAYACSSSHSWRCACLSPK